MTTYLVFPDGSGEFEADFSALIVNAETPAAAVEYVTSKPMGYGSSSDGRVFVCPIEHVSAFTINPSDRKSLEPATVESLVLEVHERPAPASTPVTPRGHGRPLARRHHT